MKNKHSRFLALLLAVLILLTLCVSCSPDSGTDESSDNESATTVTDAISTDEPSISVIVPPETFAPDTETGEDSGEDTDEVTLPPTPTDYLRVLMQNGIGEAIVSQLAPEEDCELLDRRMSEMTSGFSASLTLASTTNVFATVQSQVLSGKNDYDVILLSASHASELFCSALLEDLSEAGISIGSDSTGIRKSLTESLSLGGGSYLICPDGLVSDISASYALRFKSDLISRNLVTEALSGDFTLDVLNICIKELGAAANFDSSPLALYSAFGGKLFTLSDSKLPEMGIDSASYTPAYNAAQTLLALGSSSKDAVFTLATLSAPAEGEIYLPIPKKDAQSEYVTPVDIEKMSCFASPTGVVDGERLADLLEAFNLSSSEYRSAVRERMLAPTLEGGERSLARKLLENIESAARADLGILLGWGDLDEYISEGLLNKTSASALKGDREANLRREAIETASEIIADRLGIK